MNEAKPFVLVSTDMPVVTAAKMRALEMKADAQGMTLESLMDAAGAAVADYVCRVYPNKACGKVLVLCGGGNNGGDGFVIARLLREKGYDVFTVLLCGEPKASTLAAKKLQELKANSTDERVLRADDENFEDQWKDYKLNSVAYVIDAVFGIGFRGTLPETVRQMFSRVRALKPRVVAVDLPSGLESERHRYDAAVLPAHHTVTFTAPKPSLVMSSTKAIRGETVVASVGIPEAMTAAYAQPFQEIEADDVRGMMIPRDRFSHKGSFGSVLSVCGSFGMAGAAMLAGKAALRCGVGLLHMAVPNSIYPIVAGQLWEAVCHPLEESAGGTFALSSVDALKTLEASCSAVLVGCGLSRDPAVEAMLAAWLPTVTKPLILDADGLNFLAAHKDVRKDIQAPLILTPHPKEAARLLDVTVEEVERDRIEAAAKLAKQYEAVVVLKGQGTLVTSCDENAATLINTTGCSGMATGGSGDVLGGMIAAFAANGMIPLAAAKAGVYLHGLAGEEAASLLGNTAMLPTDLLERLPNVLSQFEA